MLTLNEINSLNKKHENNLIVPLHGRIAGGLEIKQNH